MRPTRWTRKKRVTYYGKGGWTLRCLPRPSIGYTNPATGHGVTVSSWDVPRAIRMRRKQEAKHRADHRRQDFLSGIEAAYDAGWRPTA